MLCCAVQWPSGFFLLGVGLVLLSVFMYGRAVDGDVLKRLVNWCKVGGACGRQGKFVGSCAWSGRGQLM